MNRDRFNTAYCRDMRSRREKYRIILGFWLGQLGTFTKRENTEGKGEFGIKSGGQGIVAKPSWGTCETSISIFLKKSEKVRWEV